MKDDIINEVEKNLNAKFNCEGVDFFNYKNYKFVKAFEKGKLPMRYRYFNISDKEASIIESHMYPLSITRPNCKESYLVSLVDKMVALYELVKYKAPIQMGAALIFIFNFLAIPR